MTEESCRKNWNEIEALKPPPHDFDFMKKNKFVKFHTNQLIIIDRIYKRTFYVKWQKPDCKDDFFGSDFNAHDINQNKVGDCCFLAALAAFTRHEEEFKFVTQWEKNKGSPDLIDFNFFNMGEWITHTVRKRR